MILQFIIIFLAKVCEVSLSTIRTVFIMKGCKKTASGIAFVEIMIWLNVVSAVIVGIQQNPAHMMAYALGYAIGNYVGIYIEDKLAIGLLTIHVVLSESEGLVLAQKLRDMNIGVTELYAEGKDEKKKMLVIHALRKNKDEIIKFINDQDCKAVISINDVSTVYGAYGLSEK